MYGTEAVAKRKPEKKFRQMKFEPVTAWSLIFIMFYINKLEIDFHSWCDVMEMYMHTYFKTYISIALHVFFHHIFEIQVISLHPKTQRCNRPYICITRDMYVYTFKTTFSA